jgi:hypothetical protein
MFHTGGNRIWGKPLGVPFFEGIMMVLMASHQKIAIRMFLGVPLEHTFFLF